MSNLADQLDEYLEEGITVDDRFSITDNDKADWALRKIAKYQSNIEEALALADKRIAQINEWLQKVKEDNGQQISFFEALLRPYAEQQLTGVKKRTLTLPAGAMSFKKAQPKFTRDEDQILVWAKQNAPDYIETKELVKWGELKKSAKVNGDKLISADGEVIPGVTVEEQPDSFTVKVGEK